MLILKGKRNQIYKLIDQADEKETKIRISIKPSKKLFLYILKKLKNIEIIYLTEGIYKTIPKKIITALENAKINIEFLKLRRGRPEKFSSQIKEQAKDLINKKYKTKEISKLTSLPLTTIYMLKKKQKLKKEFNF